jgi:hypothetical protein
MPCEFKLSPVPCRKQVRRQLVMHRMEEFVFARAAPQMNQAARRIPAGQEVFECLAREAA